jgi:hypothetical protein
MCAWRTEYLYRLRRTRTCALSCLWSSEPVLIANGRRGRCRPYAWGRPRALPKRDRTWSRVATPKLSSFAGEPPIALRTFLDGTDDGGGTSESSGASEEAADPRSHTPVEVSLPRRGCPRLRTKNNGRPRHSDPDALMTKAVLHIVVSSGTCRSRVTDTGINDESLDGEVAWPTRATGR